MCFCLEFKKSIISFKGIKLLQQRVNSRDNIPLLDPPKFRGSININFIEKISNPKEYKAKTEEWATDVWHTWSSYHDYIRNEIKLLYDNIKT